MKKFISFTETKNLIDNAVQLCITDGKYEPYMRDFAINYCLLKYYDDYNDSDKNFEEIYADIYGEKKAVLDELKDNCQVQAILSAIRITLKMYIEKQIRQTRLTTFIDGIFEKLDNEETAAVLEKAMEELGDNIGDHQTVTKQFTENLQST